MMRMRLSPCAISGRILSHDRARAVFAQDFNHGAEVHAVFGHAKDTSAAHAVQRLENDVVVFGAKALETALSLAISVGAVSSEILKSRLFRSGCEWPMVN